MDFICGGSYPEIWDMLPPERDINQQTIWNKSNDMKVWGVWKWGI